MWRNVTNLPAGLITVVSCLNEYQNIDFSLVREGGQNRVHVPPSIHIITISGLKVETTRLAGRVPPAGV